MKKFYLIALALFIQFSVFAQIQDSIIGVNRFVQTNQRLKIGGYGEAFYTQEFSGDQRYNGKLDVQRMVMLFAYKFSNRTNFVTELEFEHVKEVYVEQAFIQHRISEEFQFRGGLVLIPMGIVNEYHESPTFNGVLRPSVDKSIVPTTWREIGAGFTGRFLDAGIQYQAYIVNGFNSYDGAAKLRGSDALREGRQKGAKSFISSPNVTAKIEYFGIPGLKLGLSGYYGDTQSTLYNDIDKEDETELAKADSSVVNLSMFGLDARYTIGGVQLRGQYIYGSLGNTKQYNEFGGKDLGSAIQGAYVELGYNLFQHTFNKSQLIPFVRYENYNTHASVAEGTTENNKYARQEITTGIGWRITQGAMLKLDYRWLKTKEKDAEAQNWINMGIGVMF